MSKIVAIVGRPNVGKSTLFNRLIQRRDAIVDEVSGVTRDRHYGRSDWSGFDFSLIDTGGYIQGSEDVYEDEIRKQVHLAIEEADVILFMVDVTTGITDLDEVVADMLRRVNKRVIVVVNKVDNHKRYADVHEFYRTGMKELVPVSAMNGSGTGEMLDLLIESFGDKRITEEEEPDVPRFAIAGRPNAGKSTMINALLGKERHIVTPVAGTTRDSIYTRYNKFGHDFFLVDTAGIRKKGKVHEDIEYYSVMRSIRAIEYSDVCILMVDATMGFQAQDVNILHIAQRNKKGLVIVVNKWDMVKKETNTAKEFTKNIHRAISPFVDVPIIFVSALNKQRIFDVLEKAVQVYHNKKRRIKTSELNRVMLEAVQQYRPPSVKGKYIKIKYATQLPTRNPQFAFFCNLPQYIKDPYKRYLENQLRDYFDFTGVPVTIYFRKK